MTDQQMIAAIISSIQTEANLITLLQAMISNNIQYKSTTDLQTACTILGIDYTDGGS